MENLIMSFNVIAPTFFIIFLGYFLKRIKILDEHFLTVGNKLSFNVLIPFLLFNGIYQTDIPSLFNPTLTIFSISVVLILFGILFIVVPRVVKDRKQRGVIIQGIMRSNFVIFGVSIITNMFGTEKAAIAGMLSAFLVPLYNLLSVIALGVFTGSEINPKKIVIGICKNPLILSSLLAVLVSFSGITFPTFAQTTISNISAVSTPFALIILGGDFNFSGVVAKLPKALTVVMFKLVVTPAIFLPIAVMLGLRNEELVTSMIALASPTAVSSYIMAKNSKADYELASQIVVYSSSLCIVTIFLWIFILKTLMLI